MKSGICRFSWMILFSFGFVYASYSHIETVNWQVVDQSIFTKSNNMKSIRKMLAEFIWLLYRRSAYNHALIYLFVNCFLNIKLDKISSERVYEKVYVGDLLKIYNRKSTTLLLVFEILQQRDVFFSKQIFWRTSRS